MAATYEERAAKHPNATAKALLETVARKQTNLCVSVDVTRKADLLAVVEGVAPYVCLIKTCLLYTSPSPRDLSTSRMPSSA